MKNAPKALHALAQAIYDKKGFNILGLDVRGMSTMTDYYIIAEGNIDRHVIAIASAIKNTLYDLGLKTLYIEGNAVGDWIVIDSGDIVIHLFTSDMREKYDLETLWREAEIVDLKIVVEKNLKKKGEE